MRVCPVNHAGKYVGNMETAWKGAGGTVTQPGPASCRTTEVILVLMLPPYVFLLLPHGIFAARRRGAL